MFIQHITIHNFGAIRHYDADLTQELNLIESRHTDEIAAVVGFLLCNTPPPTIPEQWLQADTRISAVIHLEETTYSICAKPQSGQLQLFATDATGGDATAQYQYALSHCKEQDEIESFDGQDKTMPLRLYRYRYREDDDDLSGRTERLADTNTFHRYLCQYTQDFRPEPINSKKKYQMAVSEQGIFEARYPGFSGEVFLSETEEKLFLYICFLNIAEFWAGFETIRDLHHEKKPLLIRDFIEFLDESVNINALVARTQKLQRQIIILTSPMDEEIKKKWMGELNGIFFKSCSAVCSR
ncbi:MAG: hypothetical protein IKA47_10020 [Oscillospiraceae bacterium]|nr:hypothetical protein [Oscillospiraceae bacterium]